MSLDAARTITNVARIFEDAKLEVLSPSLFILGRELRVLGVALHAIGDNSEISNRLMHAGYIHSTVERTEFVMRKIAEDDVLSRLINDRICTENKYPNAFLPEARDHFSKNIVAEIYVAALELSKLKGELYPPVANAGETLWVVRPENEKFAEDISSLALLKESLQ